VCASVCVYKYIYIYIYIYTGIYIYTYTCIYMYEHTQTHRHTLSRKMDAECNIVKAAERPDVGTLLPGEVIVVVGEPKDCPLLRNILKSQLAATFKFLYATTKQLTFEIISLLSGEVIVVTQYKHTHTHTHTQTHTRARAHQVR